MSLNCQRERDIDASVLTKQIKLLVYQQILFEMYRLKAFHSHCKVHISSESSFKLSLMGRLAKCLSSLFMFGVFLSYQNMGWMTSGICHCQCSWHHYENTHTTHRHRTCDAFAGVLVFRLTNVCHKCYLAYIPCSLNTSTCELTRLITLMFETVLKVD